MAKVPVARKKATTIRPTKDGTVVRLYSTDIVTIKPNGNIELYTGGHNTPTTKRRMNEVAAEFELYYKVYAKGGNWYVDSGGDTYMFEDDRVIFPGPAHLIANPRLIRKRKTMAGKKRRTAKQIAATKKLVAFNKKRRGKKKVSRKKVRRKVVRKKATRRRTTRKKTTRNPSSRYWVVFKIVANKVKYLTIGATSGKPKWESHKPNAVMFTNSFRARDVASGVNGDGAAPYNYPAAKLKASVAVMRGKA